jgi:hypothetical protein
MSSLCTICSVSALLRASAIWPTNPCTFRANLIDGPHEPLLGGSINAKLIERQFEDVIRLVVRERCSATAAEHVGFLIDNPVLIEYISGCASIVTMYDS